MLNESQFYLFGQIQTSQTGGQLHSEFFPYGECSLIWASSCGSDGRAVDSGIRGTRFESSHRRVYSEHLFAINWIEKTEIRKKRPGLAHYKTFGKLTKKGDHETRKRSSNQSEVRLTENELKTVNNFGPRSSVLECLICDQKGPSLIPAKYKVFTVLQKQ